MNNSYICSFFLQLYFKTGQVAILLFQVDCKQLGTLEKKNEQLIAKPFRPFYARHCGNCADGFACAIEIVVKSLLNFTASVRCSIMKARRYFLRPVSAEQDTTGHDRTGQARQGQTWTGISFADATQSKPNYTLLSLSLFPDTYKENQPRGGVANGRNSP